MRADRLCKLCRRHNVVAVEDEIHVMFECEAYNIRNLYIDRDALTCDNEYNYIKLMNADNTDCFVKTCKFCVMHVLKFVNSCMTACSHVHYVCMTGWGPCVL